MVGLQAGLVQTAVRHFTHGGPAGVLLSWSTYAVVVTAVSGTLLPQSAYPMAPLTSSYPALAFVEFVGLGEDARQGPAGQLVAVTGQQVAMERKQTEGSALRTEQELNEEMTRSARHLKGIEAGAAGYKRLQKRVHGALMALDRDIDRLSGVQRRQRDEPTLAREANRAPRPTRRRLACDRVEPELGTRA